MTDAWLSSDQAGASRATSFPVSTESHVYLQLRFRGPTAAHKVEVFWFKPPNEELAGANHFEIQPGWAGFYAGSTFRSPTPGMYLVSYSIDGVLGGELRFSFT